MSKRGTSAMKSGLSVEYTPDVGKEMHPSAKAFDDLLHVMMNCLDKHLKDDRTRLLELPPDMLLLMITNNILMNLFFRFYRGPINEVLKDASKLADDFKDVFLDTIGKVILTHTPETKGH